jgi:hypothetical protein
MTRLGGGEDGVFEQTALIQHGVNELFGLEQLKTSKSRVETLQHLLGDRRGPILMANAGPGKSNYYAAARGSGEKLIAGAPCDPYQQQ